MENDEIAGNSGSEVGVDYVTVIMNRQGALLSHVASCVADIFFNYRTYSFLSRRVRLLLD